MKLSFLRPLAVVGFVLVLGGVTGCAGPAAHQRLSTQVTQSSPPVASFLPIQNFIPATVAYVPSPRYHTVLPKQTLWRISKMYGVPMKSIMYANHIVDPNRIRIGQRLYIPGMAGTPAIPLFKDTGRWQYIVVHHTAMRNGDAAMINRLHLKRGWKNGMGYHFVIMILRSARYSQAESPNPGSPALNWPMRLFFSAASKPIWPDRRKRSR